MKREGRGQKILSVNTARFLFLFLAYFVLTEKSVPKPNMSRVTVEKPAKRHLGISWNCTGQNQEGCVLA